MKVIAASKLTHQQMTRLVRDKTNKTPPFAARNLGDRCTEKLVPPFHDGRDPRSYRTSSGSKQNVTGCLEAKQ